MKPDIQFRMRLYRGKVIAVGPGKVALLEAIARTGSISAAAREIGMSYRRAWVLVDEMNQTLRTPVVSTATGGSRGGGTELTASGRKVIELYRAIEARLADAAAADIAALRRLIAP